MKKEDKFKKAMAIAKEQEAYDKSQDMVESYVLTRSSARYDFIYQLVMEGIL